MSVNNFEIILTISNGDKSLLEAITSDAAAPVPLGYFNNLIVLPQQYFLLYIYMFRLFFSELNCLTIKIKDLKWIEISV